jgi:hypothetical protein
MRVELRKLAGKTLTFRGQVSGRGRDGRFVAIQDVVLDGREVADHFWTEAGAFAGFARGDSVEFSGKVVSYWKNGDGRRTLDYKIQVVSVV